MAKYNRERGKTIAALAIGAIIVGLNFTRQRKTLRPISEDLADRAKQGYDDLRQDWSDMVSDATGGAEDLKGRSFWSAAGLALAATFISACTEQVKRRSEEQARRDAEPTSEERLAEYRSRFQHFRSQPGLVRGKALSNVTITRPSRGLRDDKAGVFFNSGSGRGDYADPAHFTLSYREGATDFPAGLRVSGLIEDYVSSENGRERLYVIGKVRHASQGQSGPYSLSKAQVSEIANYFATLTGEPNTTPIFVYYEADTAYWARYP